jgi:cell division protein FtsL
MIPSKNSRYQPRTEKAFSFNKAIAVIVLSASVALIFVHKEVRIDETARKIKDLQLQTAETIVNIAEARLELDELTSFPKISVQAANLGLFPLQTKPAVISISVVDLPAEFSRNFEPLNPDSLIESVDK